MAWRRIFHGRAFSEYLLVTNIIASGVIDGIGDFLEQKVERVRPHDWARTGRMCCIGFALAPTDHYWYKILDRYLPGRNATIIGKKVILDMVIYGPFCISAFYLGMCRMEGKTWREAADELKRKFVATYIVDCLVWPPAQVINFRFIPSFFRVIYNNLVNVGYSMVLSYLKHYDQYPHQYNPSQSLETTVQR